MNTYIYTESTPKPITPYQKPIIQMSKEGKLLSQIIKQTSDGTLNWESVFPLNYRDYFSQSQFADAAFGATYCKSGKNYFLLLVSKKTPIYDDILEIYVEALSCELVVILDRKKINQLDNRSDDYSSVLNLMELVETENTEAKEFFSI